MAGMPRKIIKITNKKWQVCHLALRPGLATLSPSSPQSPQVVFFLDYWVHCLHMKYVYIVYIWVHCLHMKYINLSPGFPTHLSPSLQVKKCKYEDKTNGNTKTKTDANTKIKTNANTKTKTNGNTKTKTNGNNKILQHLALSSQPPLSLISVPPLDNRPR